jgi:GT2 family glycosyltransferase
MMVSQISSVFLPSVSVVIPNYNGQHLMEQNLPAVFDALKDGDEVVIVDDASTDQSVIWLRQKFNLHVKEQHQDYALLSGKWKNKSKNGTILLVQNKNNLRFGASCNRGVTVSTHPYVFLLNTDVAPKPDVLEMALPHFQDQKVFAVGCLEKEKHGKRILEGGKNQLWFQRGMFFHSRAANFSTGETAWVSGGSGIFDKEKWQKLGGFDKVYAPAYWEDIDLSFQARKRGWKVLFDQRAVVDHNHETTNQTAFGQRRIAKMSWKNADTFVLKNGSLVQKIQHYLWKPFWFYKRHTQS